MSISLGLSPSATELLDPNLETDAAAQGSLETFPYSVPAQAPHFPAGAEEACYPGYPHQTEKTAGLFTSRSTFQHEISSESYEHKATSWGAGDTRVSPLL